MRILLPVLLLLTGLPSWSQSTLGVILGTVKDSTGAVVANANVKLTSVGESTSSETVTDASGDYAFRNVKAGTYSVTVTRPGFRSFTATEIGLVSRETLRVDAQLAVGDVSQSVQVEAVAGVIATDTPVVASTLTTESVLACLRTCGRAAPRARMR